MRVLKLETAESSGLEGEPQSAGGIREVTQWESNPRIIFLHDRYDGERLAAFTSPDHRLTPRVVEMLRELLQVMENERRGGGPALDRVD